MTNLELVFPEIFLSLSIMFLLILGVFKKNSSKLVQNISLIVLLITAVITFNETIGAAYMLWLYKRVIFGNLVNSNLKGMVDLNRSELFILTCLAIPTLFFGFYPDPLINTIEVSISDLISVYNYNIVSN